MQELSIVANTQPKPRPDTTGCGQWSRLLPSIPDKAKSRPPPTPSAGGAASYRQILIMQKNRPTAASAGGGSLPSSPLLHQPPWTPQGVCNGWNLVSAFAGSPPYRYFESFSLRISNLWQSRYFRQFLTINSLPTAETLDHDAWARVREARRPITLQRPHEGFSGIFTIFRGLWRKVHQSSDLGNGPFVGWPLSQAVQRPYAPNPLLAQPAPRPWRVEQPDVSLLPPSTSIDWYGLRQANTRPHRHQPRPGWLSPLQPVSYSGSPGRNLFIRYWGLTPAA